MRDKLSKLMEQLNHGLVGREETIKLSLLTLLGGENTVLFGPPGTAKSEISRRISQVIDNGEYFEYLLTKFTTPEEIFGPLSINELKQDRFKRNTKGYMPTSSTAFLDEIFKANSSILNSLLTIINEKTFHNGNLKEKAPLISLIGASNELPIDDTELNALYDRFLTRIIVDYVTDEDIDKLFDISSSEFKISESLKMSKEEIERIKIGINTITIPNYIRELIKNIRLDFNKEFKENNQESISDRKLIKVLKILKVSAFTNGRTSVDISDIVLLKYCLWNNPSNLEKISNIIISNVKKVSIVNNKDEETLKGKTNTKTISKQGNFDFKGEGTEGSPFLIEDEEDLIHMGSADYTDKGYYFKQVNDIEISSTWHSIANFKGSYDGNNKNIIMINNPFFNIISDSTLRNIVLKEVKINSNKKFTGGIVNKVQKNTRIKNCNVEGNMNSYSNLTSSSGGIVGKIEGKSCRIANCSVNGDINSSSSSGGIVGNILEENCRIENCSVNGGLSSSSSSSGGIVGNIGGGNCSVANCSVNGGINSSSSRGIVGKISTSIINTLNNYITDISKLNNNLINSSNENSRNGKSLSPSSFTEKFYRRLGWDLENIWEWNKTENKPILRNCGYSNIERRKEKIKTTKNNNVEKNKLSELLNNNIWL